MSYGNFENFDNADIRVEAEIGSTNPELQDAFSDLTEFQDAKDDLINRANRTVAGFEDRLANLPDSFTDTIHDQVVDFWRHSADQYDIDHEDGLDELEFAAFSDFAIYQLAQIIDQYAPSVEEQEEAQEAVSNAEEASDRVEIAASVLEGLDLDNLDSLSSIFSPENLENPDQISNALASYQGINSDTVERATEVNEAFSTFMREYDLLQQSRRTVAGTWGRLFGDGSRRQARRERRQARRDARQQGLDPSQIHINNGGRQEMILADGSAAYVMTETQVENLRLSTLTSLQELEVSSSERQTRFLEFGENLNSASDSLLARTEEEQNRVLEELGIDRNEVNEMTEEQRDSLHEMIARRESLNSQRTQLIQVQAEIEAQRTAASTEQNNLLGQQELIQRGSTNLSEAITDIEQTLSSEELNDEQRSILENALRELNNNFSQVQATNSALSQASQAGEAQQQNLLQASLDASNGVQTLTEYSAVTIDSIASMTASLDLLDTHLEANQASALMTIEQFDAQLEGLREYDASINESVLYANLNTAQALSVIPGEVQTLEDTQVHQRWSHDIWDGTIGLASSGLRQIGNILENTAQGIRRWNIPVLSPVAGFTFGFAGGVAEGMGIMFEDLDQLFTPAGWDGVRAIFGRNPSTGEWSFNNAGRTIRIIASGMVGGEEENVARGMGVAAFNLFTVIAGIGAAKAGTTAARASYVASRGAGLSISRSILSASGVGIRIIASNIGDDIARLATLPRSAIKGIINLPNRLAGNISSLSTRIAGFSDDIGRLTSNIESSLNYVNDLIEGFSDLNPAYINEMSIEDLLRRLPDNTPPSTQARVIQELQTIHSYSHATQSLLQQRAIVEGLMELSINSETSNLFSQIFRNTPNLSDMSQLINAMQNVNSQLHGAANAIWHQALHNFSQATALASSRQIFRFIRQETTSALFKAEDIFEVTSDIQEGYS